MNTIQVMSRNEMKHIMAGVDHNCIEMIAQIA